MAWSTAMVLLLLSGCNRTTKESAGEPQVNLVGAVAAVLPATPDTMPLALVALPSAALESLRRYAPTFVPFADSSYPQKVIAEARKFGFHGLMVIRGDLQGLGRVDYAIAGRDAHNVRVIALMAEVDGTYLAVPVTTWPVEGTTLDAAPPLQLMRDPPCAKPCASAVIIIPLGASVTRGTEGWIWVPKRKSFVLEEFPD